MQFTNKTDLDIWIQIPEKSPGDPPWQSLLGPGQTTNIHPKDFKRLEFVIMEGGVFYLLPVYQGEDSGSIPDLLVIDDGIDRNDPDSGGDRNDPDSGLGT